MKKIVSFSRLVFPVLLLVGILFTLNLITVSAVAQPDLVAVKTNNVGGNAVLGGTFTWKIRIQNNGTANAVFAKEKEILKDEMSESNVNTYGLPVVSTSAGVVVVGSIDCTQGGSKNEDLKCKVSNTTGNSVTIPPAGYIDVSVVVTPTAVGTFVNPKATKKCEVDKGNGGEIPESNETNNTCSDTVTVAVATGTIVIVKDTVPNDAQDFAFTTTGTGLSSFSLDDDADVTLSNTKTFTGLTTGVYTVTESSIVGFDLTSLVCVDPTSNSSGNIGTRVASINVAGGETVTCTYTNIKRGRIIIEKNAVPDSNTQAFTFNNNFGNGNGAIFNLTDTTAVGLPSYDAEVLPGIYSVSENSVAGWQASSTLCSDGSSVGSIAVSPGEIVTCTFTNQQLAKIILVKNTEGGNAAFDFDATGTGLPTDIDLTTVSGTASQTFENLDPDNTYSIVENVTAGWDLTSSSCTGTNTPDSITPNAGEEITCTFINTKTTGTLIVEKVLITDDGGDATESDFSFSVNEGEPNAFEEDGTNELTVAVGTYSVTELETEETEGYGVSYEDCDDIDIGPGETKTCTVTNDDQQATIIIIKDANGGDDTFNFSVTDDEEFNVSESIETEEGSGSTSVTVDAGTYDVIEEVLAGWNFNSVSCEYDEEEVGVPIEEENGETITLGEGDTVTCTFINTVIEVVVPECSNKSDDDEDGLINENDPGCHNDGNVNNGDSYNAEDNSESNESAVCSDGFDNDEDTKVDSQDPGCHTDANVNNPLSWNPNDTNETNDTECSDGLDNDEDGVSDENDPSCYSGGDVYDPSINNESTNNPNAERSRSSGSGGGAGGSVLGAETGACDAYMDTSVFLKKGFLGNNKAQLLKLQQFLLDYLKPAGFTVDGVFGDKTEVTVKQFQAMSPHSDKILKPWGLTLPTGVVYKTTTTEINNVLCPDLDLPVPSDLTPYGGQ